MIHPHWHYFLTLDSDLERASRYVEIHENNFKTYSIEFVRLLLATGAEIDVVAKELCERIKPNSSPRNINEYRNIIIGAYPKFHTIMISTPRYGISLTPWASWGMGHNPDWWEWYNKVKHERYSFFPEANLKNVLDSLAALFGMALYLYHQELNSLELESWPKVFSLPSFNMSGIVGSGEFKLPDF